MSRKKLIITGVILALVALIGGMLAYFTDVTETKVNTFEVGNVKITLTEPAWTAAVQAEAKNLTPGKELAKDPTITNTGNAPAYVFVKVEVPSIAVINSGNTTYEPAFSYDLKSDWKEITTSDTVTSVTTANGKFVHIYAYATDANTIKALAKAGSSTVFDKVKFIENHTSIKADELTVDGTRTEDGIIISSSMDINVTGYAIQTTELGSEVTTPADIYAALIADLTTNP